MPSASRIGSRGAAIEHPRWLASERGFVPGSVDAVPGPATRRMPSDSNPPCAAAQPDTFEPLGPRYRARGTAYYPHHSRLGGGFLDRRGRPLHTLQDYLAGRAPYVSVAMDTRAFPYGTKLRIPELEARHGRPIELRVVDTHGAFRWRGTSRIDICVKTYRDTLDRTINGPLTLIPVR